VHCVAKGNKKRLFVTPYPVNCPKKEGANRVGRRGRAVTSSLNGWLMEAGGVMVQYLYCTKLTRENESSSVLKGVSIKWSRGEQRSKECLVGNVD